VPFAPDLASRVTNIHWGGGTYLVIEVSSTKFASSSASLDQHVPPPPITAKVSLLVNAKLVFTQTPIVTQISNQTVTQYAYPSPADQTGLGNPDVVPPDIIHFPGGFDSPQDFLVRLLAGDNMRNFIVPSDIDLDQYVIDFNERNNVGQPFQSAAAVVGSRVYTGSALTAVGALFMLKLGGASSECRMTIVGDWGNNPQDGTQGGVGATVWSHQKSTTNPADIIPFKLDKHGDQVNPLVSNRDSFISTPFPPPIPSKTSYTFTVRKSDDGKFRVTAPGMS